MGAPSVCEERGVPNVSYNGSTDESCPATFIVSSRIDWTPYFYHMIKQACTGGTIEADWTGTIDTESVLLTDINDKAAAEGTADKIAEVKKGLLDGTIHVFDTKNFTVGGETLTSYMADVDTDKDFTPDTEVIKDGIFYESKHRSAPYFDIRIDGITLVNEKY
jgi:basic membrane protein A